MNQEEYYRKYRNKICIMYLDNEERRIKWFSSLSKAQDFQESGQIILSMINLKHAQDEQNIKDFLDALLYEGFNL
tara:strand:- start:210 stop:434 length:225 start_codon:yes stop_codon:yes gene_type:complete